MTRLRIFLSVTASLILPGGIVMALFIKCGKSFLPPILEALRETEVVFFDPFKAILEEFHRGEPLIQNLQGNMKSVGGKQVIVHSIHGKREGES